MGELGAILPVYHGLFAGRWANRKWTGEGYDTAKVKGGSSRESGKSRSDLTVFRNLFVTVFAVL